MGNLFSFSVQPACCNTCEIITIKEIEGMSQAKQQLEVFHDPFSNATSQPKIPDGKSVQSLGQSNQTVGSFRNEVNFETIECILYAGQNSGFAVAGIDDTLSTRQFKVFGYQDSGGPDWSAVSAGVNPDSKDEIFQRDGYGAWRVVSQGLRLSLLNAAEEDDGWFEAVRLNESFDALQYSMATLENSTDVVNDGTIGPIEMIRPGAPVGDGDLTQRTLANQPSYVTGLLRDLKNHQFELHGRVDHHDYTISRNQMNLWDESLDGADKFTSNQTTTYMTTFNPDSSSEVKNLVDNYIDGGYDMIYIRLHCRSNVAGDSTLNGSEFHFNLCSNQEIQYQGNVRDSRYMTTCSNVGVNAVSKHATLRRLRSPAAHRIM